MYRPLRQSQAKQAACLVKNLAASAHVREKLKKPGDERRDQLIPQANFLPVGILSVTRACDEANARGMIRNATNRLALRRCRACLPTLSTHASSMESGVSLAHHHAGTNTCNAFLLSTIRRSYFTNTDAMKRTDPYHTLGLEWGATTTEIKEAFRKKARELHPDVNETDTPDVALHKFQTLQKAYSQLMDSKGAHRDDLSEEWQFAVWRTGDRIAEERTDVAGVARKRPAKPAESLRNKNWGVAALGHPDQRSGNARRRGELLGDCSGGSGSGSTARSSTVGTGQSKWVTKKEYVPWNGGKS